jgi:hypothetical protein
VLPCARAEGMGWKPAESERYDVHVREEGPLGSRLPEREEQMKRMRRMGIGAVAGLLLGLYMLGCDTQPAAPVGGGLSGIWWYSDTHGAQSTWNLLQFADGSFAGVGTDDETIQGTLSGNSVSLRLAYASSNSTASLTGTASGNTLTGTLNHSVTGSGEWTAMRPNVSGSWLYSNTQGRQSTWALAQASDGSLSGTGTDGEAIQGTLKGVSVSLSLTYSSNNSTATLTGKASMNTLTGTFTNSLAEGGSWTATKTN